MLVFVDDKTSFVFVRTDDVRFAYALGLRFYEEHPDLKKWSFACILSNHHLLGEHLYRKEEARGIASLAAAIRKGPSCPHVCPRHPEGYKVVR